MRRQMTNGATLEVGMIQADGEGFYEGDRLIVELE